MGDQTEDVSADDEFNKLIKQQALRVILKGNAVAIVLTLLAVIIPL